MEMEASLLVETGAVRYSEQGMQQTEDAAMTSPFTDSQLQEMAFQSDPTGAIAGELLEARRDARRYRALREDRIDDIWVVTGIGTRDYGMSAVLNTFEYSLNGDALDKEIDAALAEGK